jgi:outer membrane lipoprotein-sorting protein
MALSTTHPALRWAVPGAVVAIVIGAATVTSMTADAAATLPPRSAAELLVDVQNANVSTMSGTLVQKAELGLPEIPVQVGGQGSSEFSSLVSGTHTLRIWYDGEDQQRLALLGTLGESDLVRNGTDVWTWSSDDNSATHYQLVSPDGAVPSIPDPAVPAYTPQQAADAALAAIDPTTTVTSDDTTTVAGRSAYELVLTPKDDRSLVGEVRIAIDGEQHIPLRVQVTAKGAQAPAVEVGFTQISFDAPDPKQFTFTPPPGATVTESTLGQDKSAGPIQPDIAQPDPANPADVFDPTGEPTIIGTGWTSVLVATMPTAPTDALEPTYAAGPTDAAEPTGDAAPTLADPPTADGSSTYGPGDGPRSVGNPVESILGSLPQVSGTWGSGRLLKSALFSVLLTDDGRVIAGAVAPELLYEAAAQ